MGSVSAPIVIVEGFDVIVHPSLEAAERWLEPWWVTQREGIIYDALGHRLDATLSDGGRKVSIARSAAVTHAAEELRSALIAHLQRSGRVHGERNLVDLPLHTLIGMSSAR